jgi:hypothetical protein
MSVVTMLIRIGGILRDDEVMCCVDNDLAGAEGCCDRVKCLSNVDVVPGRPYEL